MLATLIYFIGLSNMIIHSLYYVCVCVFEVHLDMAAQSIILSLNTDLP